MDNATLTEDASYSGVKSVSGPSVHETSTGDAMRLIHRCLQDCVTRVENHPATPVRCSVHDLAEIENMQPCDWGLSSKDGSLVLDFRMGRERAIRLESRYDGCDMELLNRLRDDGLKVVSSRVSGFDTDNKAVSLELVPDIPVILRFDVVADSDLQVWVVNVGELGARRFVFSAADVDAEFCFQLDEFLMSGIPTWLSGLHDTGEVSSWRAMTRPRVNEVLAKPVANILSFERPISIARSQLTLQLAGLEYQLDAGASKVRLGRSLECAVRVDDLSVSRKHAYLWFEEGEFYLEDTSSNGTFIQHRGKPELFIHRGFRKLCGEGVISLGASALDPDSSLIHFRVEAGLR